MKYTDENTPGIYPCCRSIEAPSDDPNGEYHAAVRKHLEDRSGFTFDRLAIDYMIEEWRTGKEPTIYQHAVKTGLIYRMRIKP